MKYNEPSHVNHQIRKMDIYTLDPLLKEAIASGSPEKATMDKGVQSQLDNGINKIF